MPDASDINKASKKVIIIGATSGIGRELTRVLARDGYTVGITGRRRPLLEELKLELGDSVFIQALDVTDAAASTDLTNLIHLMAGVDLVIISAGTGFVDPLLPWQKERETIETNVLGFAAVANTAWHHFSKTGAGHLVGISSIAAIRGGDAPAYYASKAFVSSYLQGLRCAAAKSGLAITVTDIQPGFVDTAMAQGEGLFWVASPKKAAAQIFAAIKKRKKHAYVTRRWRLIGWALKLMPDALYHKL